MDWGNGKVRRNRRQMQSTQTLKLWNRMQVSESEEKFYHQTETTSYAIWAFHSKKWASGTGDSTEVSHRLSLCGNVNQVESFWVE